MQRGSHAGFAYLRERRQLFQTTPQNITQHIRSIYDENELDGTATCKSDLQVRVEGARQVKRQFTHGHRAGVISACEFDTGETRARASGRREEATAAFKEAYYRRLKAGEGPAAALAATQQTFRSHPNPTGDTLWMGCVPAPV